MNRDEYYAALLRAKERETELEHSGFKYIDKIKTASGKWRYIYADAKNAASKATKAVGNYVDKNITGESAKNKIFENSFKKEANEINYTNAAKNKDTKRMQESAAKGKKAAKELKKAETEYNKSLSGKLNNINAESIKNKIPLTQKTTYTNGSTGKSVSYTRNVLTDKTIKIDNTKNEKINKGKKKILDIFKKKKK